MFVPASKPLIFQALTDLEVEHLDRPWWICTECGRRTVGLPDVCTCDGVVVELTEVA